MSGCATRISIRTVPSRSTSRTSTASASSTSAFTTISIVSRIAQLSVASGRHQADNFPRPRDNPLCGFGLRFCRTRLRLSRLLDQPAHGVGGLRAFANPVLNAVSFEIDLRRLAGRIVRPEILEICAVAFGLLFFDYYVILGMVLLPGEH